MKTLKTLIAVGMTTLLFAACGSSKDTTSANRGQSNSQMTERTETTRTTTTNRASKNAMDSNADTDMANRNNASYNMDAMDSLYADLDMDDSQISQFKREWKSSMDSWNRNNRNKAMNNYERIENQDRILRDILDDSQYEKYQQWTIDNADGEE